MNIPGWCKVLARGPRRWLVVLALLPAAAGANALLAAPPIDRVDDIRARLLAASAAPADTDEAPLGPLAAWMNWPNWGKWANWNNWNNWGNWGNWAKY